MIHDLFLGGARTDYRYPPNLFPQKEMPAGSTASIDDRSGNVMFSPTRWFAWKSSDYAARFGCGEGHFSDALSEYLESNTFADGDTLNAVILPQMMSVREVWWNVIEPLPGVTAEIRIRDLGTVVGTINLGVVDDGVIEISPLAYIPRGKDDMLQIVLTGPVTNALLECSVFEVSPLITRYCTKIN